jgi:hypothetical protein
MSDNPDTSFLDQAIQILREYFQGSHSACSAAVSEVYSFCQYPEYSAAIRIETGMDDDLEAVICWAKRRGEVWRCFDQ